MWLFRAANCLSIIPSLLGVVLQAGSTGLGDQLSAQNSQSNFVNISLLCNQLVLRLSLVTRPYLIKGSLLGYLNHRCLHNTVVLRTLQQVLQQYNHSAAKLSIKPNCQSITCTYIHTRSLAAPKYSRNDAQAPPAQVVSV